MNSEPYIQRVDMSQRARERNGRRCRASRETQKSDRESVLSMSTKLRWSRSEDGYCSTVDRRYSVGPLFCGTTRAQAYEAIRTFPYTRITRMASTQAEAKEACQEFEDKVE